MGIKFPSRRSSSSTFRHLNAVGAEDEQEEEEDELEEDMEGVLSASDQ